MAFEEEKEIRWWKKGETSGFNDAFSATFHCSLSLSLVERVRLLPARGVVGRGHCEWFSVLLEGSGGEDRCWHSSFQLSVLIEMVMDFIF